jgi:hypothetical protein
MIKAKKLDYDHSHYYDQWKSLEDDINMIKHMFVKAFGFSAFLNMSYERVKQHVWFIDESDSEEDTFNLSKMETLTVFIRPESLGICTDEGYNIGLDNPIYDVGDNVIRYRVTLDISHNDVHLFWPVPVVLSSDNENLQ